MMTRQTATPRLVQASATLSDLKVLRALWVDAFEAFGYAEHHCEALFFDLNVQTRVLKLNDAIVGVSMYRRNDNSVELVALLVAEKYRRQKVGRRLLEALVSESIQRQIKVIKLHTAVQNVAARSFFELHGFRVDQEDGQYPRGQRAIAYRRLL